MYRGGKPVEDIAQDTDMPVEAVRDILKTEGLLRTFWHCLFKGYLPQFTP